MSSEPIDPPPGCQEIPGFIVELGREGPWLTQDGFLTSDWKRRGVWETAEAAETAAAVSVALEEMRTVWKSWKSWK